MTEPVRDLVSDSWRPSHAARVDHGLPPHVLEHREVADVRAGHPLAEVLRHTLPQIAGEAMHMMIVTDARGSGSGCCSPTATLAAPWRASTDGEPARPARWSRPPCGAEPLALRSGAAGRDNRSGGQPVGRGAGARVAAQSSGRRAPARARARPL